MMVEELTDPLLHIIRNAIDHGIESPEKRRSLRQADRRGASSSPPTSGERRRHRGQGRRQGDRSGEDHRGRRAGGGSSAADETVTPERAFELIFMPGFSSAAKVSEISGRGVGLDVVRKNIRRTSRAPIDVISEDGQGTTFADRCCRSPWRSSRPSWCAAPARSTRCRSRRSRNRSGSAPPRSDRGAPGGLLPPRLHPSARLRLDRSFNLPTARRARPTRMVRRRDARRRAERRNRRRRARPAAGDRHQVDRRAAEEHPRHRRRDRDRRERDRSRRRRRVAHRTVSRPPAGSRSGGAPEEEAAMYREFFGLRARPFGKTPDPAFLYESRQHREALARLEYAVEEMDLALLTGTIGSGKTTLSAGADRPPRRRTATRFSLVNPRHVAGAAPAGRGRGARHRADARGRATSSRGSTEALRALRGGKRAGRHHRRGAADPVEGNLRGDPAAHELPARRREPALDRPDRPARAQGPARRRPTRAPAADRHPVSPSRRSTSRRPAATSSTGSRPPAAGRVRSRQRRLPAIHELTGGVPRLINSLATTCLLEAFGREARRIDAPLVEAAARELDLASMSGRRSGLVAVKNG